MGVRLFVVVAVLAPLVVVRYPPLVDYYSHLTRGHIVTHLDAFADFYRLSEFVPPNVLGDGILIALTSALPLEAAGTLFLAGIVALDVGGLLLVHRALYGGGDGTRLGPLLGASVLTSWAFFMGFLNYFIGLGAMMVALASVIALRSGSRPDLAGAARVGAAALVGGLLLYFIHVYAYMLFAIVVGVMSLRDAVERRELRAADRFLQLCVVLLPLGVPVALAAFGRAGSEFRLSWKRAMLHDKFTNLLNIFDVHPNLLVPNLIGFAILTAVVAKSARVRLHPAMTAPLLALLAFYFAAPRTILSAGQFDNRLPVALALLACASLQVGFHSPRHARRVLAVFLVLLTVRAVALTVEHRHFDRAVARMKAGFERLEAGSVLFVAIDRTSPRVTESLAHRRYRHTPSIAAWDEPVLVTTVHAWPLQHAVVHTAPWAALPTLNESLPRPIRTPAGLDAALAEFGSTGPADGTPRYLAFLFPHDLSAPLSARAKVLFHTPELLLVRLPGVATGVDG